MGRTKDLSDFQLGTVIGCHLSKKSVREISALLELPQATVSYVIVNWKRLCETTASPQSGKAQKSPQQDRRLFERVVNDNRRSPVAARTTESQTASGSTNSPRAVRQERRGMSIRSQLAPNNKPKDKRKTKPVIKSPSTKPNKAKKNTVAENPE